MLTVAALFTFTIQSQNVFNKGDFMLNVGIGAPHSFGFIPTVNFSGEFGVIPTGDIGLVSFGGLAEFQLGDDGNIFPRFYVGPRAAWHLLTFISTEFDVYAGAGFGIVINGNGLDKNSGVDSQADAFVGGRWMFSPGMGLFVEIGYSGLSSGKFGLTFGL